MTKVGLFREDTGTEETAYRAVTVRKQAMGPTPGEALDALTAQLPSEDGDTLI